MTLEEHIVQNEAAFRTMWNPSDANSMRCVHWYLLGIQTPPCGIDDFDELTWLIQLSRELAYG